VKYLPHLRRATSRTIPVCLAGLWVVASAVAQDPATDESGKTQSGLLDRFVAEVNDLSASFEQSRFDDEGELLDEIATGRFSLLRPDRFRWHQDSPIELIVDADGEFVWNYDVDLEQAERRPLSELAATPFTLLSGEGHLDDAYRVAELPGSDGLDWIELTPADAAASDFVSARIGFDDGIPVVVELIDSLESLTRAEFFDIEVNTGLDTSLFRFDPPDGVHVVGAD